jgi:hypothetical protein
MEQLSGVCAVPAYRPPDGQGKKGLKEQDDDMFGLTPYFALPPFKKNRRKGTGSSCLKQNEKNLLTISWRSDPLFRCINNGRLDRSSVRNRDRDSGSTNFRWRWAGYKLF